MIDKLTKEIWRFRLNWVLTSFVLAVLYVSGIKDQFSSLHRYVTNPELQSLNGTHRYEIEAGLGESELFYSGVMATLHFGAIFGGLSMGVLVRFLPYWYLFVSSVCLFVLGSTLYAVSYMSWLLIIAELLIGFFRGAALTLSYSYAVDSSKTYSELQQQSGYKPIIEMSDAKKSAKIRDLLFAIEGVGRGVGFIVGPATSVIFSYLINVDPFRSIGWFNMAHGVIVFILIVFLFRGESSCKGRYRQVHCDLEHVKESACLKTNKISIIIIVSMHLLAYVESTMWGYFEALLSPVLSDSFGFSINMTAYVFLAFSVPKIFGSLLVILFQWLKISIQVIGIIGISITICGYIALTDWQTIGFDPCTQYSPFHHPEIIPNITVKNYSIQAHEQALTTGNLYLHGSLQLRFDNGHTEFAKLPFGMHGHCSKAITCDCDREKKICLAYISKNSQTFEAIPVDKVRQQEGYDVFKCSLLSKSTICVMKSTTIHSQMNHAQNVNKIKPVSQMTHAHNVNKPNPVYTIPQLTKASNDCMNAVIPGHSCHWIPRVAYGFCEDCPPICRSTHKTLNLAQIFIGSSLLLIGYSLVWVTTLAISSNLTPKKFQGLIIGTLSAAGTLSEATSPMFLDAIYEGMQKRLFPSTIAVAIFSLPFLLELILLQYWNIGSADKTKDQIDDCSDCDRLIEKDENN